MSGIVRVSHSKGYTCIKNDVLRDKRLSFKARGIHHFLLSFPDNWSVKVEHIVSQSDCDGRTAVMSGLQELESFGYLQRTRIKDEFGKYEGIESVVYEEPQNLDSAYIEPTNGKPDCGSASTIRFPDCGFSDCGKPDPLISNESTKYQLPPEESINPPLVPQNGKVNQEGGGIANARKNQEEEASQEVSQEVSHVPSSQQSQNEESAREVSNLSKGNYAAAAPPSVENFREELNYLPASLLGRMQTWGITFTPKFVEAIKKFNYRQIDERMSDVESYHGEIDRYNSFFLSRLSQAPQNAPVKTKEYPRPNLEQMNRLAEIGDLVYTRLNVPGTPEVAAVDTGKGVVVWWDALGLKPEDLENE